MSSGPALNSIGDSQIGGSANQYAIYDDHNWLFTTEAGIHCTDYFTVDRTGTYIINVIHLAQESQMMMQMR